MDWKNVGLALLGFAVGSVIIDYAVLEEPWTRSDRLGDFRKAEVRPACYRAIERVADDRDLPSLPSGGHRIDILDFNRARDMAAALHCYLVTNPTAVCNSHNRTFIVDYVVKYFSKRDEMLATAAPYGEAEVRNVRNLWDSGRNRQIYQALESDIRDGRLSKADFGWSAPESLKGALEKHASAADACTYAAQTRASAR